MGKVKTPLDIIESFIGTCPPIAYEGSEDSVGHCAYCYGFNGVEHTDSCDWMKAREAMEIIRKCQDG